MAQAATRLKVTRRTVLRRIRQGAIAATKTGPGTAGYVVDEAEIARLEGAQR